MCDYIGGLRNNPQRTMSTLFNATRRGERRRPPRLGDIEFTSQSNFVKRNETLSSTVVAQALMKCDFHLSVTLEHTMHHATRFSTEFYSSMAHARVFGDSIWTGYRYMGENYFVDSGLASIYGIINYVLPEDFDL